MAYGALKEPLLRGFALRHSIKFGADIGHAPRDRHASCARRAHCCVMFSHHPQPGDWRVVSCLKCCRPERRHLP